MQEADRERFDRALRDVRASAYPPGGYVGQEGFMPADEILSLARHAGIRAGTSVLDLCCGAGGPGRLVTSELGCAYVGVDASPVAVALARERTGGLDCRYVVAHVPPVPPGPWDVVLLLETALAFPDKGHLAGEVAGALPEGGRFAFTLEAGAPLTASERAQMPDAGSVWPTPLPELVAELEAVGLTVRWQADVTWSHVRVVDALLRAFDAHAHDLAERLWPGAVDELVAGHRLWRTWLREGRMAKHAVVAVKQPGGARRAG